MRRVCVCVCVCWGGGGATTTCQNRLLQADLFSLDHHNCTAYPKTGCQGDQGILMKCQKKQLDGDEEGGVGGGEGQQCSKPTSFFFRLFFLFFSLDHHNYTAYPDASCQGDQALLPTTLAY